MPSIPPFSLDSFSALDFSKLDVEGEVETLDNINQIIHPSFTLFCGPYPDRLTWDEITKGWDEVQWADIFGRFRWDDPDNPWEGAYWRDVFHPRLPLDKPINIETYLSGNVSRDIGILPDDRPGYNRAPVWTLQCADISYEVLLPHSTEDYTRLVTWQHRRPKLLETLKRRVQAYVDVMNTAHLTATRGYNIDTSTGYELDVIGKWVGLSRDVYPPITIEEGGAFAWDLVGETGWDQALWADESSGEIIGTSVTELPDEIYRLFLKAKIAANRWDGTIEGMYAAWRGAFGPETGLAVLDNQNMSLTMVMFGIPDTGILRTLLAEGYLPLKPAGVSVNYQLVPDGGIGEMIWDNRDRGWNVGSWSFMI